MCEGQGQLCVVSSLFTFLCLLGTEFRLAGVSTAAFKPSHWSTAFFSDAPALQTFQAGCGSYVLCSQKNFEIHIISKHQQI